MNGDSVTPGKGKAAIFLLASPSDVASQVLKFLSEDDVAPLLAVGTAPVHERGAVLNEFGRAVFGDSGEVSYYRELLQGAREPQRADDLLQRLTPKHSAAFDQMRRARRW